MGCLRLGTLRADEGNLRGRCSVETNRLLEWSLASVPLPVVLLEQEKQNGRSMKASMMDLYYGNRLTVLSPASIAAKNLNHNGIGSIRDRRARGDDGGDDDDEEGGSVMKGEFRRGGNLRRREPREDFGSPTALGDDADDERVYYRGPPGPAAPTSPPEKGERTSLTFRRRRLASLSISIPPPVPIPASASTFIFKGITAYSAICTLHTLGTICHLRYYHRIECEFEDRGA
jgi:hypothetical protein